MKTYSGTELLSLLVESEQKVAALYHDLAKQVTHPKAIAVFEKLAKDEERHEEMYTALMKKYEGELELEVEDTVQSYLDSLVKFNYFRNEAVRKRFVKEEALLVAEKVERDTLLLAQELNSLFPEIAPKELNVVKPPI